MVAGGHESCSGCWSPLWWWASALEFGLRVCLLQLPPLPTELVGLPPTVLAVGGVLAGFGLAEVSAPDQRRAFEVGRAGGP